MGKKLLFVYNPKAGKAQIKNKLADILNIFAEAEYEITVAPTRGHDDARRIVENRSHDYELVVCSGGDGTLDETVTGMMQSGFQTPIGYIPAGSTNDFGGSLGLPKNMVRAAEIAVKGKDFSCDVGSFNKDIFVYIAAFGLFTDVSYQTKQSMKNVLGHLAYVLEGAKRLFNIPSYRVKVTHDDEVIEDEFVYGMVTNSRSVGGFRNLVGKQVGFDDGVFEVTLIKTPKNPIELQEIIAALMIQQMDSKYMYTFKSGRIMFESIEEIPWTLDGEFGGEHDEVVIENLNKELQIMVPGTHEED